MLRRSAAMASRAASHSRAGAGRMCATAPPPGRARLLRAAGGATFGVAAVGGSGVLAVSALPSPPPPPLPVIHSPDPAPRPLRVIQVTLWGLVLGLFVALARAPWPSLREWAEVQAVRWLEVGGPTFVKLGQWLATRRDMFSEAACEALSRLHTNVRASFEPEVKADAISRAERAIGAVIDTSRSIGQGCLGQVYMARLDDGRKVVAKVLRPKIDQWLQDDIEILRYMAHRFVSCFPSMKEIALGEAIDIFGYWMNVQADLTIEAQQLDRFRSNFANHKTISCPAVHYASRDVLIMDYVEGESLSELLHASPRSEFVEENADAIHNTLGNMMGHMLIQDNFVHQDLHPGNLILERTDERDWLPRSQALLPYMPRWLRSTLQVNFAPPNPFKIHVIDAGLAVQMELEESSFFKSMIVSVYASHDPVGAGETAYQLHERHGRCSTNTVREEFVKDIGDLLLMSCVERPESVWRRYFPDRAAYMRAGLAEYLDKFINEFRTHGVRMEPSIWSILCSFALLEGTMRQLKLGVNGLDAVLPYVFDLRARLRGWAKDRYAAIQYAVHGDVAAPSQ